MAYDDILEELKSKGRHGDTELAHVTPGEAMLLKALGGSGTINPETGLKEYYPDYYQHPGQAQYDSTGANVGNVMNWKDYTELDPAALADASGDYSDMQALANKLMDDVTINYDDFAKYMPKYDERGEFNIRQSRAFDRLSEARSGQAELLEVAQNKYGQQSRSGFASTGNPMIDKQRQDLMTDMSQSTSQAEWAMSQDIYDYQEEFQQKFGERLIAYEDRIEKKNADDDDDGGGGCCFIVLEASEGTKLDKYVRKYRDMACTETNRKGYYKLAQVVVPFMRKSKLAKWFFKYTLVAPAKSYAKWYYTGKGIGWVFEPLRKFWLNTFDYLGHKHKLKTDNE